MTVALVLLAVVAGEQSRLATGIGLAVFGLGFGMVGQVLIVAVQNSVDRRQLGVAMAATASSAASAGGRRGRARRRLRRAAARAALRGGRANVIDGVQTVFLVAAPLAALALLVVLRLREVPLQTDDRSRKEDRCAA